MFQKFPKFDLFEFFVFFKAVSNATRKAEHLRRQCYTAMHMTVLDQSQKAASTFQRLELLKIIEIWYNSVYFCLNEAWAVQLHWDAASIDADYHF